MALLLTGDFFTIVSIQKETGSLHAMLELNIGHPVFAGHFPGQPVVPGACLLQMIKELLQQTTEKKLQLAEAHHLKFLAPVDPRKNRLLEMKATYSFTEENQMTATATFSFDEKICCKFNGIFSII